MQGLLIILVVDEQDSSRLQTVVQLQPSNHRHKNVNHINSSDNDGQILTVIIIAASIVALPIQ